MSSPELHLVLVFFISLLFLLYSMSMILFLLLLGVVFCFAGDDFSSTATCESNFPPPEGSLRLSKSWHEFM